jgi:hypothetical protein
LDGIYDVYSKIIIKLSENPLLEKFLKLQNIFLENPSKNFLPILRNFFNKKSSKFPKTGYQKAFFDSKMPFLIFII